MTEKRRLADETRKPSNDDELTQGPGEALEQERLGKSAPDDATAPAPADTVDVAVKQRDEYLEMLQRLQAEFENFRKRTMRQQTDLLQRASERLIEQLLPVLDALDLAVAHAENDDTTNEHLKGALVQIDALLRKTLNQEGLERIDEADVPFDPEIHDAVAHVPAANDEGKTTRSDHQRVNEVMRAGYRLHGRVLRPAMVKVEG